MDIEQARQLAKDETTPPKILAQLATNEDNETRRSVASNPNTPTEVLLSICFEFPNEAINNPVVSLMLMENPLVFTCERELNFNELKKLTDREILRLGWTKEQAKNYLISTYGKRTRLHLSDKKLFDFLYRLQSFNINNLPTIKKSKQFFTRSSSTTNLRSSRRFLCR